MHQHHHHGTRKVLGISFAATALFVVIEAVSGVQARSLALLSDAGHNFTDALALLLALFGVYLQSKPADDVKTFGYHRGGVLAAFINAITLIFLSLYLFYESYQRLLHPEPVAEWTMVVVAGLGLVLNVAILLSLRGDEHGHDHDVNIRAASVHMLGDALGSVAIIIGAVAIHFTGWLSIDPILSILIGLLIIWSAIDIIRESLNILLEGLPRGMELGNVIGRMRQISGVIDVHDVHIWSLGSGAHALSCHALIDDMPPSASESILHEIRCLLAADFKIHHTTVQFEHTQCDLSEKGCSILSAAQRHSHSH